MQQSVTFPSGKTDYLFIQNDEAVFEKLTQLFDNKHIIFITNDHIAKLYDHLLIGWKVLTVPAHENSKDFRTIAVLAKELLQMEAGRNTVLVGLGGGVITDITGFLAAIYMRGVVFGFIPTTLLGMVDAAIGGKNGVNVGFNKNLLGTIRQPQFILYDLRFLQSLPNVEWSNGFAEVIKYACIFDAGLFAQLEQNNIGHYKQNDADLFSLIEKCADWKNKTVMADELETGVRKLLNFGHTAAHAIENLYELPHGKAVAIGMVIACMISENVTGLDKNATTRLKKLLQQYHLPVSLAINAAKAMELLRMDKKRKDDTVDYIVLERIGNAAIKPLPFKDIENALTAYASHN